jgi:hypothetical protein
MNPSVQVSASKLLVYPGEEVTLNGRGASIFVWDSTDGKVKEFAGPQLKINPTVTTTLLTVGSGLDLCLDRASTTIYVRENVTAIEDMPIAESVQIYPNPGDESFHINLDGSYRGPVFVDMTSTLGKSPLSPLSVEKNQSSMTITMGTNELSSGLYLVRIRMGSQQKIIKWLKR